MGLTDKSYQSADTDVGMCISKQEDATGRHYLYEAADVLLITVKRRFALRNWALNSSRRLDQNARAWGP